MTIITVHSSYTLGIIRKNLFEFLYFKNSTVFYIFFFTDSKNWEFLWCFPKQQIAFFGIDITTCGNSINSTLVLGRAFEIGFFWFGFLLSRQKSVFYHSQDPSLPCQLLLYIFIVLSNNNWAGRHIWESRLLLTRKYSVPKSRL